MSVFVLDKQKQALMPCSEKRARLLLSRKLAVVHRMYPFTIRLKNRIGGDMQPVQLKLDPGSKTTGVALVLLLKDRIKVLHLFHLQHRGQAIKDALEARRGHRRMRRAKLWYRPARFDNRTRKKGWLPPSLQHRVDTTVSLVTKLSRFSPVFEIIVESVKFDMQLMDNPDIASKEYQQGTLAGYTVKEYLLEKHNRTCVYCSGASGDPVLEVEHIHPRSKGGTNSIKNLTLSCKCCNQHKGADSLDQWSERLGNSKIDTARKAGIKRVASGKTANGLKHAAAVNATRNRLVKDLVATGIPVQTSTGAQTKLNRHEQQIPKDHCLDAVCVGAVEKPITDWKKPVLNIKAMGRGSYQRAQVGNKSGLVVGHKTRAKVNFGFQTGDMVKALVPEFNERNKPLKTAGVHVGRIAVRSKPFAKIVGKHGKTDGINPKYISLLQRADGYEYK
ncbi:MAG: HNH endonuclease [Proteobacteria bacterium]|nr:HNH endonuclease [Pseudomonadota bacterium]